MRISCITHPVLVHLIILIILGTDGKATRDCCVCPTVYWQYKLEEEAQLYKNRDYTLQTRSVKRITIDVQVSMLFKLLTGMLVSP